MKTVLIIVIFAFAWIYVSRINDTALRAWETVQFLMDQTPIPWSVPTIPITTRI